ncbi:Apoptosis-inducing factor-like protein A [Diplonema papillatum]|nr:Apoptosis-inducing factor-like protein A [Diplonema papillatum]
MGCQSSDSVRTMSKKTVVILGGGFAGVQIAHRILKKALSKVPALKVILVTPNTQFYWNIAAVRAVVPGEMADDVVFADIASNFASYPKTAFEMVVGTASSLTSESNTVGVELADSSTRTLTYDQLVIATGSSMVEPNLPFKLLGTTEATKSALHTLQKQIASAKSIVIAGGGATGVETAGELGEKYAVTGAKSVTLVVSSDRVLNVCMPKTSAVAAAALLKNKVKIVYKTRVKSHENGQVLLSTGTSLPADVYLPLVGVRPNTDFVPSNMTNAKGEISVDTYLRAKGKDNVWAIGDCNDVESKMMMKATAHADACAGNLVALLTGSKKTKAYKASDKVMMFATVGKKAGTGEAGGFKFPSFMVSSMKGKALFSQNLRKQIAG